MGRIADATFGRSPAPAEEDTTTASSREIKGSSLHGALNQLSTGTPTGSDELIRPEASHNIVAKDMTDTRRLMWENGGPRKNPPVDLEDAFKTAKAITKYVAVNSLTPNAWLRGINEFFSYGKNWLEANEYNLVDLAAPDSMQTPAMQSMLAKKVLTGQLTPLEAAHEGLRIDSGDWDLDDIHNKLRGLLGMSPSDLVETQIDGKSVTIPKLSTSPSAGDMYVDITEEDWWRRVVSDKAYDFLDNCAIEFSQLNLILPNSMAFSVAQSAASSRADLSVMDVLRFATFMMRDPLFLVPVDQIYRGGKAFLGFKGTPEVRALTGGKPLIINRALIYDTEVIERYNAERSAAISEFMTTNAGATPEDIQRFTKSLPDIVAWHTSVRRGKLIKNYNLSVPNTPEVANRRAAYENAIKSRLSDKEVQNAQKLYFEAIDGARTIVATGVPGKPFEESVRIAAQQLREHIASTSDIGNMTQDQVVAEQMSTIFNNPNLTAEQMAEELMKFARSPEQIDEVSSVIRQLENASELMTRVKRRLKNAGLTEEQISKRIEELMADAVVGLQYRSKYGARKVGVTGAESMEDWLNPLIMSDEDLAFRDLLANPEVEDFARLIRKGDVPELSPIKLSAMSYFWGDPYFIENFAPLAMAHREAQLAMVDYLNTWQTKVQKIVNRIGLRGRDKASFGALGADRANLRELYGKALAIEQTIPKSEIYKYLIVDGKRITAEEVRFIRDKITSVMHERSNELNGKVINLEKEIKLLQNKRNRAIADYERRKLVADLEVERTGKPQDIGMSHPDSDPDYIHLVRRTDEYQRLKQARDAYETEIAAVNDGVALQDILANPAGNLDRTITELEREISKVRNEQLTFASRKGLYTGGAKIIQRDFDQELSGYARQLQKLKDERAKFPASRRVEIAYDEILSDHADEFKDLTQEDWNNIGDIRKLVGQLYEDLLIQRPELATRLTGESITSRNLMSLVNVLKSRSKKEVLNFDSKIARDNAYFLGSADEVVEGTTASWDIMDPLQYVINESNRQIHLSPVITEMQIEVDAAKAAGDYHRSNYLKIILARIKGEPTELDKSVDAAWYAAIDGLAADSATRKTMLQSLKAPTRWATGIVHGYYRGLLTGNTGFAIKNLFQTSGTVGLAGRIPTLKAAYRFFCTEDGMKLAEHAHLTYEFENFMAMSSVRSSTGRAIDQATMATEQVNRGIAFWTGVNEGLDILVRQGVIKNANVDEAVAKGYGRYVMRQGTDCAFQTQHIYGAFGSPAGWVGKDLFGSDVLRPGTQFVNFQLKQTDMARRMLENGNTEGLIRWFQTSGHIVRMLSDAGVNGSDFVGPYMGDPDATGPAPTLGIELLQTGGSMLAGDGMAADRHWQNTKRLGLLLAGGSVGIPMTPIMRGIEYVKGTAGPDSTEHQVKGAGGQLLQQLDDKDAIFRLMGLPSTTAEERMASTTLLRELQMRSMWTSVQNANILATIIQDANAEDRPLDETEQLAMDGVIQGMIDNPISMTTSDAVMAAYRRYNVPQNIRQLLSTTNISLLRKANKIDKIRSMLEVNKLWLQNQWGKEDFEKTYKSVAGVQYEESTLNDADAILQKGSNNGTQ